MHCKGTNILTIFLLLILLHHSAFAADADVKADTPKAKKKDDDKKESGQELVEKVLGLAVSPEVASILQMAKTEDHSHIVSFNKGKGFESFFSDVLKDEGIVKVGYWEDIVAEWESKQWKNPKMRQAVRNLLQNVRKKSMGQTQKQQIDFANGGYVASFYLAYEELPDGRTYYQIVMLEGTFTLAPDYFIIHESSSDFFSSESYDRIEERPRSVSDVDVLAFMRAALASPGFFKRNIDFGREIEKSWNVLRG